MQGRRNGQLCRLTALLRMFVTQRFAGMHFSKHTPRKAKIVIFEPGVHRSIYLDATRLHFRDCGWMGSRS
jgi:hypothetical protein